MSSTKKIVITYAKSLFQNLNNSKMPSETRVMYTQEGEEGATGAKVARFTPNIYIIGEELLLLRSLIFSSKKFTEFIQNPTNSEKKKLEVLLMIFPGFTVPFNCFLKVLTERNHLSLLPEITEEYSKILLQLKNCTKVKLTTPTILQESYGNLLLTTLKKLTNSESILLSVAYNPNLIGGFLLEYKSTLVDLTLLKEFSLFFSET